LFTGAENGFNWFKQSSVYQVPKSERRLIIYRVPPDEIRCSIPHWLPTLLFAVPAAWMWRVDVKRRSVTEGCCAKCGYSLVGTPAERPCPECGTSVAPKPERV